MKRATSSIIGPCVLHMGRLPGKSTIWGTREVVVPILAFSPFKTFILEVAHSGSSSLGMWPGQTRLPRLPSSATFLTGRDQGYRDSNYSPKMTANRLLWQPVDPTSGRQAAHALAAVGTACFWGMVGGRMEEGSLLWVEPWLPDRIFTFRST